MTINAYDRIMPNIYSVIVENELISSRKIKNLEELKKITKSTVLTKGLNIESIETLYKLIDIEAVEYFYDNGLILLDLYVTYEDKSHNIHKKREYLITNSYCNSPIINIVSEESNVSIQQLMLKDCPSVADKKYLKRSFEVYINGNQYNFEEYIDKSNNEVFLEKYSQNNNSIFDIGTRCLEVAYYKKKPIYTQISNQNDLESIVLNDKINNTDNKIIVSKINDEVNKIIFSIYNKIGKHECDDGFSKLYKLN